VSTPGLAQSDGADMRRIANPLHTLALLAVQAVIIVRGVTHANQARVAASSGNVAMYLRTMVVEWLLFGFVLLGVWLAGTPLTTVLGPRWRSWRDTLRDIGIGIAFIVVQQIVLSGISAHLHGADSDRAVLFLMPHGRIEGVLWIALSLSAGICEETVFRGYLQRQFTALTRNIPTGILLSAAMFAMAHSYQGLWRAAIIGLDGAMLGGLAYWCKSTRPGMAGHAFKDALAPLVMGAVKH
jgi:membrane protease YdiL (CAAX protease family)